MELSPDGKRVAVFRAVNGNRDIWLTDAARGVPTRFTFDAAYDSWPVWSPDGSRVVFQSNRKGVAKGSLNNKYSMRIVLLSLSPTDGPHDHGR